MRSKIYGILNKTYGVLMTVSFFAGFLPLFPFIFAIIVGGGNEVTFGGELMGLGQAIALFLKNSYYPVVIAAASISVIIGITAHCIGTGKKIKSE